MRNESDCFSESHVTMNLEDGDARRVADGIYSSVCQYVEHPTKRHSGITTLCLGLGLFLERFPRPRSPQRKGKRNRLNL